RDAFRHPRSVIGRRKNMNHVVLYQPEIPQNTGNIARTCVGTGTPLHLIKPYGFSLEDKYVKRAGLDYWKDLELYEYESIEEFFEKSSGKYYMISKFGKKHFTDMDYSSTEVDHYFVFGRETKGLPDWLKRSEEHTSELQSRFDIVCRLLLE